MIGTYINLSLPTLGSNMATIIAAMNTALSQLRDSIADEATQAAINITGQLSLNGNWLSSAAGLILADGNAPNAAGSIYYHSGEFYAIDSTQTVQITKNGQLNLTGVGGIGGDYGGANQALVSYNNATSQYRFYVNPNVPSWADLAARSILFEGANGTMHLQTDGTQTGAQTVTWLTAIPAATKGLAITSAGHIVTADDSTAVRTLVVPACAAAPGASVGGGAQGWTFAGTSESVYYPLVLPVGSIIIAWRLYIRKPSSNSFTCIGTLLKYIQDTQTVIGTQQTNSANAPGYVVLGQSGLSQTTAATEQYFVTSSGGAAGDQTYQLEVDYTYTH